MAKGKAPVEHTDMGEAWLALPAFWRRIGARRFDRRRPGISGFQFFVTIANHFLFLCLTRPEKSGNQVDLPTIAGVWAVRIK
jgi:hypothetical protein